VGALMTTALEAAGRYTERRWAVIPVPYKQKGPALPAWQSLRLTAEDLPHHFGVTEQNIGVLLGEPSGGLVDIDLDSPEAAALAEHFLPDSPVWSGRERRPRTHVWYYATGTAPKTARYQTPPPNPETLVELRATGTQTLVAPSVHPEGDRYQWHVRPKGEAAARVEPARIPGATLERRVAMVAAGALLARLWPAEGSRHDLANALAGMLTRGGWTGDEAEGFVYAVAAVAGDEEARERAATAAATARKLGTGGRVTGGPTLAQLIGDAAVEKVRE
jgi:putative DNA primase/helicase